jgi:hypothetical protein
LFRWVWSVVGEEDRVGRWWWYFDDFVMFLDRLV